MYLHHLVVLLPLVSVTIAYPRFPFLSPDTPIRACGEKLDDVISLACAQKQAQEGKFNKRSITDELFGYDYEEDGDNDRSRHNYFPKETSSMVSPMRSRIKKQGIVGSCCWNSCTLKYIMTYYC